MHDDYPVSKAERRRKQDRPQGEIIHLPFLDHGHRAGRKADERHLRLIEREARRKA